MDGLTAGRIFLPAAEVPADQAPGLPGEPALPSPHRKAFGAPQTQ